MSRLPCLALLVILLCASCPVKAQPVLKVSAGQWLLKDHRFEVNVDTGRVESREYWTIRSSSSRIETYEPTYWNVRWGFDQVERFHDRDHSYQRLRVGSRTLYEEFISPNKSWFRHNPQGEPWRLHPMALWKPPADLSLKDALTAIKNPQASVRQRGVTSLASTSDREALYAVLPLANQDRDAMVRALATRAVMRLAFDVNEPMALAGFLRPEHTPESCGKAMMAADALQNWPLAHCALPAGLLTGVSMPWRLPVAESLLAEPDPPVAELAEDPDPMIRILASMHASPKIWGERFLTDDNPHVRYVSFMALRPTPPAGFADQVRAVARWARKRGDRPLETLLDAYR